MLWKRDATKQGASRVSQHFRPRPFGLSKNESRPVPSFNPDSTYIGETTKLLERRVFQHRRDKNSHICLHISNCEIYKSSLQTAYGDQPSESQQRSHLLSYFKVVESNLQQYNARKTFEGLMITLERPDLNKQVLHRSTALVCKCILPTETALTPGV